MTDLTRIIEESDSLNGFLKKFPLEEDAHVVLCALLYLQQTKNRKSIAAEEINNELKTTGLGIKGIHRLLYELKDENPPFVEEVKQSKDYPPQSVFYRITDAGKRVLEEFLKTKKD